MRLAPIRRPPSLSMSRAVRDHRCSCRTFVLCSAPCGRGLRSCAGQCQVLERKLPAGVSTYFLVQFTIAETLGLRRSPQHDRLDRVRLRSRTPQLGRTTAFTSYDDTSVMRRCRFRFVDRTRSEDRSRGKGHDADSQGGTLHSRCSRFRSDEHGNYKPASGRRSRRSRRNDVLLAVVQDLPRHRRSRSTLGLRRCAVPPRWHPRRDPTA